MPASELDAAIARLDKLAWLFKYHQKHGWQRENPNRLNPPRIPDSLVHSWAAKLATKVEYLVDDYLEKLARREDQLSPHTSPRVAGSIPLLPTTWEKAQNKRRDRCPNCGTSVRAAGRF